MSMMGTQLFTSEKKVSVFDHTYIEELIKQREEENNKIQAINESKISSKSEATNNKSRGGPSFKLSISISNDYSNTNNEEIRDQCPNIIQFHLKNSIFNHNKLQDLILTDNLEINKKDTGVNTKLENEECKYDINYATPEMKSWYINQDNEFENEIESKSESFYTAHSEEDLESIFSGDDDMELEEEVEEEEEPKVIRKRRELITDIYELKEEHKLSTLLRKLILEEDECIVDKYVTITENEINQYNSVLKSERDQRWFELDGAIFTTRMLECLSFQEWLNDEVINGYMKLLQCRDSQIRKYSIYPKCHFFKSFFCEKLFLSKNEYDYEGVKRWTITKRLSNWGQESKCILDCDILFFPVHLGNHWVMATAYLKYKRIIYYDSLRGERIDVPTNILRYIVDEARDKLNEDVSKEEWIVEFPKQIPVQFNGHDCGIFSLQYAKYLSMNKKLTFSQDHMHNLRIKVMSELLKKNIEC